MKSIQPVYSYQGWKNHFTEAEIHYLVANYPIATVKKMAAQLGKSKEAVESALQMLRIRGLIGKKKTMNKSKICVEKLSKASETDIAYMAGLVDGEGTISITPKKDTHTFRPFIEITNTDPLMIEWLHRYFWQKVRKGETDLHRPVFKVHLTGYGITPFLERIKPYLTAKKIQCSLLIAFINLRQNQNWKDSPSAEMLDTLKDLRILNSRKKGTEPSKEIVRAKYAILLKSLNGSD
jgi:hypothetical protein